MAKNFKNISNTLIDDADLLRLSLHILGSGYLEDGVSRCIEVITEDEVQEIIREPEVTDSKKKKKRQMTLRKKKRDTRAAVCLSASRFHGPSSTVVSGFSALSTFARSDESLGPVSGLSASSDSNFAVLILAGFYDPSAIARFTIFVSESFTPSVSA